MLTPSFSLMNFAVRRRDTLLGVIDWAMACVPAGLIAFSALAIGAVNRAAFVAMEISIFTLVLGWIIRTNIAEARIGALSAFTPKGGRLVVALAGVAPLLTLQLIPMPPFVLHLLSPGTYHVYQIAFPGWPHTKAVGWLPLTLSPAATSATLLEFAALASLFVVVLLFPTCTGARQSGQSQALRLIVYPIIATGAVVAMLGIGERVWWNGRILWFYQPADWSGPLIVGLPRASGPFVNADHFANYLALSLPLAVAAALFPRSIGRRQRLNARLFCGTAALLMLMGEALSLSRGGWLATCVGVAVMLAMCPRRTTNSVPAILVTFPVSAHAMRTLRRYSLGAQTRAIVTCALIGGLTLYLIGGPARNQIAMRMVGTSAGDFSDRVDAWRDTLMMIRDFPLFGAGAGAWPEIFPHYQPPPKDSSSFFRTADNDYVQFVAENGVAGLIVLMVVVRLVIGLVNGAPRHISAERLPLFAGLAGGIGAGLVHEFVDSSLHIPANALLFTMLLALMLRVALEKSGPAADLSASSDPPPRLTVRRSLAAATSLLLIIAAWNQEGRAYYPYSLYHPSDLIIARGNVNEHPAISAAHIALARMMPDPASQRGELSAAVWLDPNSPFARDLLAHNLLLAGRKAEALAEVSNSVYRAPYLEAHYYLVASRIPWLLPEEQQAIGSGFSQAVDSDFIDAVHQQASFYLLLGRDRDAAEAYEHGARASLHAVERVDLMLEAGREYARLKDFANAARVLVKTSNLAPHDPRPYAELAQEVYAPQRNLAGAVAIITRGIGAGAEPYTLEIALASTAEATTHYQIAEAALSRARDYDPSFDVMLPLGRVYLAENRFELAVAALRQAAQLDPHSADAFIWLGRAYEANYDYYQATQAFQQARRLMPEDKSLDAEYRELCQRIANKGQAQTR